MSQVNCTYFLSQYISREVFVVVSLALLVSVVIVVIKNSRTQVGVIGLLLLISGGLQNMYRRVMYKCVLDNINFFNLFVFNISDLLITLGVTVLIFEILINGKKNTSD